MIGRALRLLVEQEQEIAQENREIRALLDERWKQANDPATAWLDGEQVFAELEAEIDEYEKNLGV
jgi:septal ring factor EnvC (AmiA/AmiB activator)